MKNTDLKKPAYKDWSRAQIIAALHDKGITLAALARAHGLCDSTSMSIALTRSFPKGEKRIADALDCHPMVLWPSRYHADGTRKAQGFRAIQKCTPTINSRNSKAIATDSSLVQTA